MTIETREPIVADTTSSKPAEQATTTHAKRATAVPDGHRRVVWAYNAADTSLNGTAVDVPAEEARALVEDGRARYAPDGTALGAVEEATRTDRRAGTPAGE